MRDAQKYGVEVNNAILANRLHSQVEEDVVDLAFLNKVGSKMADVSDGVEDKDKVEQDTAELVPSIEVWEDSLTMARVVFDIHGLLLQRK